MLLGHSDANARHPSLKELIVAQGLRFPRDPRDLPGHFWPEEESIDDFLSAVRDKTDPAA